MFKEGDLVWLHLRKERFPNHRKNKLMPRCDGPFKILKKVGDNAYQVELPGKYGVHATFNIGDLSPYIPDEQLRSLRSNSSEEGEDDTNEDQEDHNFESLVEAAKKNATMVELLGYGDSSLIGSSKVGICVCMVTHT